MRGEVTDLLLREGFEYNKLWPGYYAWKNPVTGEDEDYSEPELGDPSGEKLQQALDRVFNTPSGAVCLDYELIADKLGSFMIGFHDLPSHWDREITYHDKSDMGLTDALGLLQLIITER